MFLVCAGLLVAVLQLAEPLQEQETLVYGLGTIKLLASSPHLREQMASSGVMDLTVSTLKACSQACAAGKLTAGEMVHVRNIVIQVFCVYVVWFPVSLTLYLPGHCGSR